MAHNSELTPEAADKVKRIYQEAVEAAGDAPAQFGAVASYLFQCGYSARRVNRQMEYLFFLDHCRVWRASGITRKAYDEIHGSYFK